MSQGQEAVSDREARLCRRIECYAERRARETPQEKRERLSNRRERDAITCSSRLTACTSLFRNMKLNAIVQSGSPPNVLHLPSVFEFLVKCAGNGFLEGYRLLLRGGLFWAEGGFLRQVNKTRPLLSG